MPEDAQPLASTGRGGLDGLLGTIGNLASTGRGLYDTIAGRQSAVTPPAVTAASAAPETSSWTKYLPWVIGGVVLLVVLGVFMRK